MCVQHISNGFIGSLVQWLDSISPLIVRVAVAQERLKPGLVYFPPEDKHLVVQGYGRIGILNDQPFSGHRPSVDMLFRSVALQYGNTAISVLLSGMGRDGADGMAEIAREGGITIAQDESSSVVFGMPKEAIQLGAVQHVLSNEDIGPFLNKLVDNPDRNHVSDTS